MWINLENGLMSVLNVCEKFCRMMARCSPWCLHCASVAGVGWHREMAPIHRTSMGLRNIRLCHASQPRPVDHSGPSRPFSGMLDSFAHIWKIRRLGGSLVVKASKSWLTGRGFEFHPLHYWVLNSACTYALSPTGLYLSHILTEAQSFGFWHIDWDRSQCWSLHPGGSTGGVV